MSDVFHPIGQYYERNQLREGCLYIGSVTYKKYWIKCGLIHIRILKGEKAVWIHAPKTAIIESQLYHRIS